MKKLIIKSPSQRKYDTAVKKHDVAHDKMIESFKSFTESYEKNKAKRTNKN